MARRSGAKGDQEAPLFKSRGTEGGGEGLPPPEKGRLAGAAFTYKERQEKAAAGLLELFVRAD